MRAEDFYLGTDCDYWLGQALPPLFLSRRKLCRRKSPFPAHPGRWALDSGGFSELSLFGRWTVGARQYADEAQRWHEEIGPFDFCAAMDWMVEPVIRHGGRVGKRTVPGTGLSVAEHQRRTVESYLELRSLAPRLPWLPVLQGWGYGEYLDHLGQYERAGVDLAGLPRVGLGSVCRRQNTRLVEELIRELCGMGIRVHAFGFKTIGLARAHTHLASSDSMAWCATAWKNNVKLPGCTHRGRCCHCLRWALQWRAGTVLPSLGRAADPQGMLFQ